MIDHNMYFDSFGLLHVKKGEYSENGILFLAYYVLARRLKHLPEIDLDRAIYGTMKRRFYDPNPSDSNGLDSHFSHDNMTGLKSLLIFEDKKEELDNTPIIRWNKRNWLHPRDIATYTLIKALRSENPVLALLALVTLLPFIALIGLISASRKRPATSGKMLTWLRLNSLLVVAMQRKEAVSRKVGSLLINLTIKAFHGIINLRHKTGMADVASIYFREEDHPVRVVLNR